MAKLEVQIQTRKTLKPSTPTPNHLQSLNLSLFDQLQSGCGHVPLLFYYLPSSEQNMTHNTERCAKLQNSLTETLTKFYPLAGRFRKDDLSIHCNDEGVEYVETKVNADLAEFLHDGSNIELLQDLLPWCVPPDINLPSSPLLGVQVNIFNCGGLVIGIQISHILADAFTIVTFVNEWSHVSLTGTTTDSCLPSFGHLSSLYPTIVLPEFTPLYNGGAKIVTRRFLFDALAITKLKERIDSSATDMKPTRVVAVMSLIWKVLVGISSAKQGHSRDSCLLFPVNLRRKTNIPSLQHALGNFCMSAIATTLEANQSRKELNDFVNLVGSASRDKSLGVDKASIDEKSVKYDVLDQKDEMDIYVCTSWCRFPLYEADFGWGKPFWVSTVGQDANELVVLFDTKDGDGIDALIGLKENVMAEFERDPDILTFCPDHSSWMKSNLHYASS